MPQSDPEQLDRTAIEQAERRLIEQLAADRPATLHADGRGEAVDLLDRQNVVLLEAVGHHRRHRGGSHTR